VCALILTKRVVNFVTELIDRQRRSEAKMAGGGFSDAGTLKRAHLYQYKITGYFIYSCIVGALGGSLFGYDLGVSGEF